MKQSIPAIICFLGVFFTIFLMSYNMPYTSDDFNFSHITWTNTKIDSISDILVSQGRLYMNTTGRILAHFLIQLFLFLNRNIYLIFNSAIFCLFIYLILKFMDFEIKSINIILMFSLIWLFSPVFGETVIWISGTFNYLWTVTLLFGMFLMYKNIGKIKSYILIIFISFLAGFTHENTAFLGASFIFYNLILDQKYILKKIISAISFFIGVGFLLLAPGTLNRASGENASFAIDIFAKIIIVFVIYTLIFIIINWKNTRKKINAILSKNNKIIKYGIYTLMIYYVSIFLYKQWKVFNFDMILAHPQEIIFRICAVMLIITIVTVNEIDKVLPAINLIIISVVSLLPMEVLGDGSASERSLFAFTIIIIIATIILVKNLVNNKIFNSISLFVGIFALPTIFTVLNFYCTDLNMWNDKLENSIEYTYKSDSKIAVIEQQPKPSRFVGTKYMYSPILNNPNAITNVYTARYYGLDEVIGYQPNTFVVKLTIDSGDKNNLIIDISDSGNIISYYNDNSIIEPSKNEKNMKEVYFQLPNGTTEFQIKNTNNETFNITSIDIYTETSTYNYSDKNFNKILDNYNDKFIVGPSEKFEIKNICK